MMTLQFIVINRPDKALKILVQDNSNMKIHTLTAALFITGSIFNVVHVGDTYIHKLRLFM